ncbi:hypothetical protein ACIBLA_05975 [Streptomyces sp. NPDC050433]|uniref:hypothetical protein n=1 Tax=Streptomyces sp. NPDC050433 TaxID=3365615 RepID=UPI0037AE5D78
MECDFAQPVRLMKLLVFSGTSARKDEFLTQARPALITVQLTSQDGELTSRTIRLRDQPGEHLRRTRLGHGTGQTHGRLGVRHREGPPNRPGGGGVLRPPPLTAGAWNRPWPVGAALRPPRRATIQTCDCVIS